MLLFIQLYKNNLLKEIEKTEKSISALVTTVHIDGNPLKKDFTVEGEILGDDNKLYLIHLSKSKETTDLDNVEIVAPAQKIMKNGQLIITKDGVEFNAQGTTITYH